MEAIPWAKPFIGEEEVEAVTRLLRERRISMGAEVRALEHELAGIVGRRHGVAVSNGTVALDLALRLAGIGPGDRVLVSALSYIATVNSIVLRGATPAFCDVDPATLNIASQSVADRASGATALMVADYCGSSVDYAALELICAAEGLKLVVDGAQSLGTFFDGRPAISRGIVATTSLHTAKSFITGEGGMVFFDDDALDDPARRFRGQGEIPGRKYVHDTLASNYRMTDYAAAIGRVQLSRFDKVNAHRAALCDVYDRGFRAVEGVKVVKHHARSEPSRFGYAILVPERDRVAAELAASGIETRSLYPIPAYRQPIPEYAPFSQAVCPNAESAAARVLNLPLYYEMTEPDVDRVVRALATSAHPTAN